MTVALETIHSIEKGIRRLLDAPTDLYRDIPDQGFTRKWAEASTRHQALYIEYVSDFAEAYEIGESWWNDCVDACALEAGSRAEAIDQAFAKRLAGPASAPEFVWFVRTYWLAFDEVNHGLASTDRVPPQSAMLQWLLDDKYDNYVRLLTCMPYWPIGLDENGNWC